MVYINQQMRKGTWSRVLLVLTCLQIAVAWGGTGPFCSTICGTKCTGDLNNNCGGSCQSTAIWATSGTTCIPLTSSSWYKFDATSDYSGTLTVTGATLSYTCKDIQLFGLVTASSTISIASGVNGITTPYYQMQVYFGILAVDVRCQDSSCNPRNLWSSSTAFSTQFNDPQGATTATNNPIVSKLSASSVSKATYCNVVTNNKYLEYWMRVAQFYSYNATFSQLQWDITTNEATNTSALWGIREFVILIRTCHWACASCYGPTATQCYSCVMNATNTYWQSNNTCNETCISHFGYATPNVCIYCDLKCTTCDMYLDNCTACTTSGIWSAYLSTTVNPSYSTCVKVCPDTFFANKATHTCDPCNTSCATCINSANYCTSCIANTTYWTGWMCYNPCPTQYFLDPNGTNCTKCSPFCSVCSDNSTNCTVCTLSGQFMAFLYNITGVNGTCMRVCTDGFYGDTGNGTGPNLCLACDINCSLCTDFPTPCTQCKPGFYLYFSTCINTCPNGTIGSNATGLGLCLNCDQFCVDLTISMYFPSVVDDRIYIDMSFSQELNYSTFNIQTFQNITVTSENIQYTLDMFNVVYSNLSTSSYRITLTPKTYIFLYNATFTVLTETQPTTIDYSTSLMPFKETNYLKSASLTWFLIKGPPFSTLEVGIMTSLSTLSTKTNWILTSPYVQEIKKSGVFSLLFSGAQITSCSILSNQIQSQNLYEGVRIWAVFVFFDAPPYERISDKTKRFVSPTIEDRIRNDQEITTDLPDNNRLLFSTNSMYWRFQRTGQTSFFIYDVYIPMILIGLCWIGMLIAHFSTKKKWYLSYASSLYSAVHKIHEMTLMYITMAAIVEFIYFQPTSSQRILSAIICVIFNAYFAFYELYIYHDMIKYPMAEIGNKLYDYYVIRYGYFLKNVRYEQYDIHEEWTPKHWLRPYNYHILSYYKKFVMMISLPLFYSVVYAQMGVLLFIQIVELGRFWKTWPFQSKSRNYIRLSLQAALMMFFLVNLIQISLLQTIMSADSSGLEETTAVFYGIGWAGFAFCTYFNLMHVFTCIYDFCVGLRVTSRVRMQAARKKYYFQKIRDYEKDNEASSKQLVNRWVKLGNLNDKTYGELPEINVRIEFYEVKKVGSKYEVGIKKINNLKMKTSRRLRKQNNTTIGSKIEQKVVLSQSDNSRLFSIINDLYKMYEGPHVETIRLKTFLNIWQKDYEEGEDILFDRNLMFQRVELLSYDNEANEFQLQALIEDFPIGQAIILNAL